MFHVPERARVTHGQLASDYLSGASGAFVLPSPESGWMLVIIADDGRRPDADGWEHVSAHARREGPLYADAKVRTPSWREMCVVKDTFWDPDDVVVQFHPRAANYVNQHPHVLHLWRHRERPFPEPPPILVGLR